MFTTPKFRGPGLGAGGPLKIRQNVVFCAVHQGGRFAFIHGQGWVPSFVPYLVHQDNSPSNRITRILSWHTFYRGDGRAFVVISLTRFDPYGRDRHTIIWKFSRKDSMTPDFSRYDDSKVQKNGLFERARTLSWRVRDFPNYGLTIPLGQFVCEGDWLTLRSVWGGELTLRSLCLKSTEVWTERRRRILSNWPKALSQFSGTELTQNVG